MKVYLNGVLYDTNNTPVVFVFNDDKDRNTHALNIFNMPLKDGERMYGIFPNTMSTKDMQKILNRAEKNNNVNEYTITKEPTEAL